MEKKGKKEEPVQNKTVDVVADSNYSIISPEYNKAFRAWRNNEKNEYAFRCRKREGEAVYVEGVGYHAQDPAAEERRAMIRINMIIGIGMLFYLLIEHLLPAILMSLVHLLGVDVSYCYSDGTVYGNQMVVLVILMLKTLLKYLVPICIFRRSFRMPRQVAYHLKPVVPRDVPISTFVTLVVFAVANVWLLFSPINVLRTSTLGSAYYTVSYMDHSYQIIYLLFELLMVCVMQEVLIHGDMLHVLRQFGDWHAIILTAFMAVCMTPSYATALMELTFAIVSGISVIRSGSLLVPILNRILYHLLLFLFFIMEIWPNQVLYSYRLLMMLGILLIGILGCLLLIRPSKQNPALMPQKHYISGKERIRLLFHMGPLAIIFFLCALLMVIEVIL